MKIPFVKNINFRGHDAAKIKALYMQNPNFPTQVSVYNQMKTIGESEGFDVFIHDNGSIKKERLDEISKARNPWGVWSQDNKILIKKDAKTIALMPEFYDQKELAEVADLCEQTKMDGYLSELILEGGNVYLGKKENSENYFITSAMNMYICGKYLYFKDKLGADADYKACEDFFKTGKYHNKDGKLIADEEDYHKDWESWTKKAIKIVSEDFDVKEDNMVFLPEADFHIDMVIRPLEYPYVLVNDDKEVDKLINSLEKQFKFDIPERMELKKFKGILAKHREEYCKSDNVCERLKEKGFIPIKIAGAFGRNPVNFMNAIVHKNDEGLVYITNSTKNSSKIYNAMQEKFEKDLMKKYPKIKKIHYIDGGQFDKKNNNMMYYLANGNGGIHCLCCEEVE